MLEQRILSFQEKHIRLVVAATGYPRLPIERQRSTHPVPVISDRFGYALSPWVSGSLSVAMCSTRRCWIDVSEIVAR